MCDTRRAEDQKQSQGIHGDAFRVAARRVTGDAFRDFKRPKPRFKSVTTTRQAAPLNGAYHIYPISQPESVRHPNHFAKASRTTPNTISAAPEIRERACPSFNANAPAMVPNTRRISRPATT